MAGNANSGPKREKPFRDALMLAIKEAEAKENQHRALRKIAERLLDEAAAGNVQALKEVADRLDGKVPQGIEGGEQPIKTEHIFRWLGDEDK
jgi:hypothetical protein